MYTCPIELDDVRYNAATQSFEAAVRLHDGPITRTYPCSVEAPLSTAFEYATRRLSALAIQQHVSGGGLFSETGQRAQPHARRKQRLSSQGWLSKLISDPIRQFA